ncbi:MAG: diaminopimelate epimerase [Actinomycetota bacterium]|nr:diaminopimelate epimerase [Actinomycetota bacterium]
MGGLNLTKHHGLGNDFLVLLDLEARHVVDGSTARAVCDRHRGVGADGLVHVTAGSDGADVTMVLYNADGSRAEMSGNGISCVAQAVVMAGVVSGPDVTVATDAGTRTVRLDGDRATVDMGEVVVKTDGDGLLVDVGNPHLVLRDEGQDLTEIGRRHPDLNVELIAWDGNALSMRVHERGVGVTDSCGTGAVASAAAGREWGMAGDRVVVAQPGGRTDVDLSGATARYTVPVVFVARIEVP